MNICGIVCEYNPFHNGHAYLMKEIRRKLGEDTVIVCVMSGDFVQRGEAAAFAKHDRAHAAVRGGANLVLELPLPWALSSAEAFARGAVGLIGATGVINYIAFGSESADVVGLSKTAELLLRPEMDELIKNKLKTGLPYAVARQQALEQLSGAPVPYLERANDILAVEYLKAIRMQNLSVQSIAIQRIGANHDSMAENAFPSASLLREKLRNELTCADGIPPIAWDALTQGRGYVDRDRIETAVLSRLRMLPEDAFQMAPDAGEGLHRRIYEAVRREASLDGIVNAAATKRYPRARIRRICMCAALGLQKGDNRGIPPYLRVLSADERGIDLLHHMKNTASLPVIVKPAIVRSMCTSAEKVFSLGAAAADMYNLGFPAVGDRIAGTDWQMGPIIVK